MDFVPSCTRVRTHGGIIDHLFGHHIWKSMPPPYTPQHVSSTVPLHSGKTYDVYVDILIREGVGLPLLFSSHALVNAIFCLPVDLQKPCYQFCTKFMALNS